MNNLPRQKLIQIIKDNDIYMTNNPQQCKAFLLDYCGEYRLEINVLMSALQEGIVKELCNISQGIPLESIMAKLRQKLETNLAMREDAAQWAVETWALALGVITESELNTVNQSLYNLKSIPQIEDKSEQITSYSQPQNTPQVFTKTPLNQNFTEVLPNGIKLEMVAIPEGEFMMGSNDNKFEQPIHKVKLKAFYIGKYPITQGQYQAIMNENPSKFNGATNPVERVSYQAKQFCQKLSTTTGKKYQLPSEAQWEYACRAGTTTKYYFGDNANLLDDYAWYNDNSKEQTHSVGLKKPNQWGLYDMYGNVWEWCEDEWHKNYVSAPNDDSPWLEKKVIYPVIREGSYLSYSQGCRSTSRDYNSLNVGYQNYCFGFRVVCLVS